MGLIHTNHAIFSSLLLSYLNLQEPKLNSALSEWIKWEFWSQSDLSHSNQSTTEKIHRGLHLPWPPVSFLPVYRIKNKKKKKWNSIVVSFLHFPSHVYQSRAPRSIFENISIPISVRTEYIQQKARIYLPSLLCLIQIETGAMIAAPLAGI